MKSVKNYNLSIKRENRSEDIIEFSFRFNKLLENDAVTIKNKLNGYKAEINKSTEKDFYNILIEEINSEFNPELILSIISEHNLNEDNYGFWISITSEYGHGGGYVPKEIRTLFKLIGGQIDFSYMIGE